MVMTTTGNHVRSRGRHKYAGIRTWLSCGLVADLGLFSLVLPGSEFFHMSDRDRASFCLLLYTMKAKREPAWKMCRL